MKSVRVTERALIVMGLMAVVASAQSPKLAKPKLAKLAEGYRCTVGTDIVDVTAFAPNVLRVEVRPGGVRDERTPVMQPGLMEQKVAELKLSAEGPEVRLTTPAFQMAFNCGQQTLTVSDPAHHLLVSVGALLTNAAAQKLVLQRSTDAPMYGMTGTDRNKPVASIERPDGARVQAGKQGNGGAPFFFSTQFGVLIDSIDGEFKASGKDVSFEHGSRKDLEFFIMVGPPQSSIRALADLTGHAPMPPRWTLGFLNSQWGIDENELKTLVAHYRASHIPLDGFIIDYDWKAWGEDDYGESRWNSTSGAGNKDPDKFPDGASGLLAREMTAQGVHLSGILKPRILLTKVDSDEPLQAAAYADAHGFWMPNEKPYIDYNSHRPARDINFSNPEARQWFWKHLEPAFDAGMVGWWNDEADSVDLPGKDSYALASLEFFNMGRALYDGQRAHSDTRVWSLNRNYYLGAQRYGYAEWSGDIKTGAENMAVQPIRMIATLNLGEPHWSMDTGGFIGNPTSEEYARWMEFAAFTPIMRVHARHNQKRQPWIYGATAEAAAKNALQLRYSLMPYIYSAERGSFETGIGIVRPLQWIFPDDELAAKQTDEWMFGDALLVAPVLDLKAPVRKVYLPAGSWRDYATGKSFTGPKTLEVVPDAKTWSDIPLFVREGSMLATEAPVDSTEYMHPAEITVDIFPAAAGITQWTMYDDDGATYGYEKGAFFKQSLSAEWKNGHLEIETGAPEGTFATSVKSYRLLIHSVVARLPLPPSWTISKDRFGDVLEVHVKTGEKLHLDLPGTPWKEDGL